MSTKVEDEEVERRLGRYLSRHKPPLPWHVEGYDFDIKLRRVDIPDFVMRAKGWDQDDIDRHFGNVSADRLSVFAEGLMTAYEWIASWSQAGRMGGWLTLLTDEAVLDEGGRIPDGKDAALAARRRLKDLDEIQVEVRRAKENLVKDAGTPEFWGLGPKDWAPRR